MSDERGAVAVFVTVVAAVLLGVLGLAVDAGALYQERKELRNGADAAALAIAEDCALQPGTCSQGTAADIDGQGNNGRYLVGGFGLFHVHGYKFGGQFKVNPPCSGDVRCISGYFTSGAIYDGEFGGPDFGIVIVKLTG